MTMLEIVDQALDAAEAAGPVDDPVGLPPVVEHLLAGATARVWALAASGDRLAARRERGLSRREIVEVAARLGLDSRSVRPLAPSA